MIFADYQKNEITKEETWGFKDGVNYFVFNDSEQVSDYLKDNDDTYIVFSREKIKDLNNVRIINLAYDCSDNLDLQTYMGHTFKKISYEIKDELDTIEDIYNTRKEYLDAKKQLGNMAGLDGEILSNCQLVSKVLGLRRDINSAPYTYKAPFNVDESDPLIQYFTLLDTKENYTTRVAGCQCDFSRGGAHGSFTSFTAGSTPTHSILYFDIFSYYPSILYYFNYLDNRLFKKLYNQHKSGPTPATKLLLNTVSGALELYEPDIALTMRITGQILIYNALKDIEKECPSFKLLNLNTDGFICEIDNEERQKLDLILKNAKISQISILKCQNIKNIFIKDVNNLVIEFEDGQVKVAGYLNSGLNTKGKLSINNNSLIIKKAVLGALLNDEKIEDCINNDFDYLHNYQFICSGGANCLYCRYGTEEIPKVNRVYASTDNSKGTIFKVNIKDEFGKIPNLPQHCTFNLDDIDKKYYIDLAKKTLREYAKTQNKQEKEVKNDFMAETKLNVYQKLCKARTDFLGEKPTKTGHNMFQGFDYFTLDDIIPDIQKIFDKWGLIGITTFTPEVATLTIYNTDDPNDTIAFCSPMLDLPLYDNAENNKTKRITNGMQNLGAIETYQRRYLYLVALDIVELDSIDASDTTVREPEKLVNTPIEKAPAPQQRENAKINIIAEEEQATDLQVQGLRRVIDVIKEKKPDLLGKANKLLAETNNLNNITKKRCESAILYFSEQLDGETN